MVIYVLLTIGLFAFAVAELVTTPAAAVRTLPKALWCVVVLPPVLGPLAWLLFGRPRKTRPGGAASGPPPRPVAPDDDEDFLRELRRRRQDPRDDTAA